MYDGSRGEETARARFLPLRRAPRRAGRPASDGRAHLLGCPFTASPTEALHRAPEDRACRSPSESPDCWSPSSRDFRPPEARAQFTDVTGVDTGFPVVGITYGLGWADFDGNSHPDCFICRHYFKPIIYENDGTEMDYRIFQGPFDPPDDHHGALIADFDNDGDADLYLTGGADAGASEVPKKMYRNDGGFNFTNVAAAWGLEDQEARGRSPSGIDLQGDGDLDVFVAKSARVASPNSLFLNDGTPFFTDIAPAAGLDDAFGSVGGLWGDYDNDGDPDLFISGEEEVTFESRLYRNEGDLTFLDVTATALPGVGQAAAAAWGDYDNDGDLDLALGQGDRGLFDAVAWSPDSIYFFFNTRFGDDGLDGFGYVTTGDSSTFDVAIDGFYRPDDIYLGELEQNPSSLRSPRRSRTSSGRPASCPASRWRCTCGRSIWRASGSCAATRRRPRDIRSRGS